MPGTIDNASREGVVLAHTLNGSPVTGVGGLTHAEGNIVPAYGSYSTARYVDPKKKDERLCSYEGGCKAWSTKTGYCVGHSRKLGLWSPEPKDEQLEPS